MQYQELFTLPRQSNLFQILQLHRRNRFELLECQQQQISYPTLAIITPQLDQVRVHSYQHILAKYQHLIHSRQLLVLLLLTSKFHLNALDLIRLLNRHTSLFQHPFRKPLMSTHILMHHLLPSLTYSSQLLSSLSWRWRLIAPFSLPLLSQKQLIADVLNLLCCRLTYTSIITILLLYREQLRVLFYQRVQLDILAFRHQRRQSLYRLLSRSTAQLAIHLLQREILDATALPLNFTDRLYQPLPLLHSLPPVIMDHLLDLVQVCLMNTILAFQLLTMPLEKLLHILESMIRVHVRSTLHAADLRQLPTVILVAHQIAQTPTAGVLMFEIGDREALICGQLLFFVRTPQLLREVGLLRILRRREIAVLLVRLLGRVDLL